jgi:hypothetical protein
VRASVERGSTTLADVGNHDAIAPVEGTITSSTGAPVARVRVSVLGGQGYAATLVGLISAHTVVRAGGVQLGSTLEGSRTISLPSSGVFTQGHATYQVASFPVAAFAAAGARAYLLLAPPAASLCAKDPAQTSLDALAAVAERIYMGEQVGGKAVQAIDVAESSGPFKHAVAAGDRAATRAAIIEFFANRSHVVRVRVYRHGQLLIDVGGPHVLAPAWGTLNAPDGSRAGTFELAVQDDEGYLLLAHAFTGAEILLRTDHGQVMGTLSPGPTSIPDRGVLTYKGVRYHAYSFDGEAFPSGRLHISLLARG